jgi:hypothetical protein
MGCAKTRVAPPAGTQARAFTQPVSTGLGYPQTPNLFGGVDILHGSMLAEILHAGKSIRHSSRALRQSQGQKKRGLRGRKLERGECRTQA